MRTVNRVGYTTTVAPKRQSIMVETQRFSEASRMSEASRYSELSTLSETGTVGTVREDGFEEELSEAETDRATTAPSPPPPAITSDLPLPPARPPRRRPVALDLNNRDSMADDSDCSTARIGESPIPHTPLSLDTFGGDGLRSREMLLSPERVGRSNLADNRLSQLSNADMADDEGECPVEALLSPDVAAQEQMPQALPVPSFFSTNAGQRRVGGQNQADDSSSEDGTVGLAYNESPRTSLDSFDNSSATGSTTRRHRSPDVSVSDETLLDTPQSMPASRFGPAFQPRTYGSGSSNEGSANGTAFGLAPPLVIEEKPRIDHASSEKEVAEKELSPIDTEAHLSASPLSPVHDSPTSVDSRWSMESRAAAKTALRNGFYALGHHPQLTVEQHKSWKDASAAIASQISIAPSTLSTMPEPSSTPHPSGIADAQNGWATVTRKPSTGSIVGRVLSSTMEASATEPPVPVRPPPPGSLDSHVTSTAAPRNLGTLDPSPMSNDSPSPQEVMTSGSKSPPPSNDSSWLSPLDASQSPRSEALRRQGVTLVGRMETELANSRGPVPITFRYDDDAPPLSATTHSSPESHVAMSPPLNGGAMSPPQTQRYNSPRPAPPAPVGAALNRPSPSPPHRKPSLGTKEPAVGVFRSDSGSSRPSVDSVRRFPQMDGRHQGPGSDSGHQSSPLSGPVVNRLGQIDMPARRTPPVEIVRYGTPSSESSSHGTPPQREIAARKVVSPPTVSNRSASDDHHMQTFPASFKPVLPSAAARQAAESPSPMAVFLGTASNEPPKTGRYNNFDETSAMGSPQMGRKAQPQNMTPPIGIGKGFAPATPNSFDSTGASSSSSASYQPTHRARSRSFSAAIAKSFGRKPSLDLPPPMPAVSSGRKPSFDVTSRNNASVTNGRKPSLDFVARMPSLTNGRKPSLDLPPRTATVTSGRNPSLDLPPRLPRITTQASPLSTPSQPAASEFERLNANPQPNQNSNNLMVGSSKADASRMSVNSTIAVHHMQLGEQSVHHMPIGNDPPARNQPVLRKPSLQLERSAPPLHVVTPSQMPFAGHQRSASGPGSWSGASVGRSASSSGSRPSGSINRGHFHHGISSKDYADPMVRTDGMEFEILQPRSNLATAPVVKLNLDSSDLGLLPPEELARDGLEPMAPETPPETDEWGFLRDRSPTPAIFHSRRAAGDIRSLEAKWRSTISTPLNRGQAVPKKVKRMIIEQGVPASLRGRIWGWLMSNGVSGRVPGLFSRLISNEAGPFDAQIDQDVAKVYADHSAFYRLGSPGQQDLRTLLRAYLHFSPNGYRSELALIGGALLIHAVVEDAFWLMAGLFNSVLKTYYVKDRFAFRVDLHVFGGILQGTEPQLARLFSDVGVARKLLRPTAPEKHMLTTTSPGLPSALVDGHVHSLAAVADCAALLRHSDL